VRQGYDELVNAIIRPPRAEYDIEQLGPTRFVYMDRTFVRTDLVLVNQRGLALQCSHWEPEERPAEELPCVVFMHGNSSARLEGLNQLAVCLRFGLTLFSFDCAGSGKSEGKYVSLGWWEKDDLRVVVDHLRGSGSVARIAVWGRSMGAVTGLLYQVQDADLLDGEMSVNAMVLDSPFCDFCQLAEELVSKGRDRGVVVPSVVTRMALTMLGNSVQSIAGFDIHALSARTFVNRCQLPALFICAKHDDFIGTHHTLSLHAGYAGPKELIVADGDHNTLRSSKSLLAVGTFLQRVLQVP
ncbi:Alpha/Beta hydrolase protein, partial [Pelagophyceae sp. CCMP2097]